ncbi:ATP-dependent helicase HrpA [Paramagnetospirillum marisnigri]|uniref:ATP-dependent helicase HrpA n=1 Tax=Paramagnetospirillum marisnigri TaxID=1285242 RepID=A0A178MTA7_9PROT|nr:endonuclease domain-containing protein [Paramagnetospirillum marisnigri]OAN53061.1 ATP-dependent helicase HrpA [Paramagnetospirillum marisnigri]
MVTWKPKTVIARARNLRTERATDVERLLWQRLRAGQIGGAKFRRQHPAGPYFLDFVCLEAKLVIELDGGQHADQTRIAHDERRTRYLKDQGYVVLRFWNNDVTENMSGVLETILATLASRPSPPTPSPASGRGGE